MTTGAPFGPAPKRAPIARSDAGQVTVEYIVLLAVVVSLSLLAARALRPVVLRLQDSASRLVERVLDRADLHQSPFRR